MSIIETELKYLLGRESFHSFFQYFREHGNKPHLTRQVNYYFSTPINRPERHSNSTRIRCVQGRWELTCKISIKQGTTDETITDVIQQCYEYNVFINQEEAVGYINHGLPMKVQEKLFGDMFHIHNLPLIDLICFGHLRTSRFAFIVKEDLPPLLMDVNAYLDSFDYELEWELNQVKIANEILQGIFSELNIQPIGSMTPKVKRFFDRLLQDLGK